MYVRKIAGQYYAYRSQRNGDKIQSIYLGKLDFVLPKCSAAEARRLELSRAEVERKSDFNKVYSLRKRGKEICQIENRVDAVNYAKERGLKVKLLRLSPEEYAVFRSKQRVIG